MSILKITRLYCDGRDCEDPVPFDDDLSNLSVPADALRRDARREGWKVGLPGGRDLCPACRKREGR